MPSGSSVSSGVALRSVSVQVQEAVGPFPILLSVHLCRGVLDGHLQDQSGGSLTPKGGGIKVGTSCKTFCSFPAILKRGADPFPCTLITWCLYFDTCSEHPGVMADESGCLVCPCWCSLLPSAPFLVLPPCHAFPTVPSLLMVQPTFVPKAASSAGRDNRRVGPLPCT